MYLVLIKRSLYRLPGVNLYEMVEAFALQAVPGGIYPVHPFDPVPPIKALSGEG